MYFDGKNCMLMEHVAHPGSIGDSMAESGRFCVLNALIGKEENHRPKQ
jgi:hypothetical protein